MQIKLHEFASAEGMGTLHGVCRFGFATVLGRLVQREELEGIVTYSTAGRAGTKR